VRRSRRLITVAIVGLALILGGGVAASASPTDLPRAGIPWFLAVGDSITYGYSVDPAVQGNPSWATMVRDRLDRQGDSLALYSTACPGETTTTYASGDCSGRGFVPALGGRSQRAAALDAIRERGDSLRFVVVELGINDYFGARQAGGNVHAQLDAAAKRLDAVVSELQRAAPGVPVILANIYDPHGGYDSWAQAYHFDQSVAAIAAAHHAAVAGFLRAVAFDRCRYLDCAHDDIHPTVAGDTVLAGAVIAALQRPPSR
jgi:lysophospholipase L1-like esterase